MRGRIENWLRVETLEVEAGAGASVRGRVRADLELFATHFPRRPVLPGVLLLQGLIDLAADCLLETSGRHFQLEFLESARFRRPVGPDAELKLSVRIRPDLPGTVFSGTAEIGGGPAATVRTIAMRPVDAYPTAT